MSKSKKNGVDPADFVNTYGPEAVRFAMLFAAPYAVEVDWTDDVVRVAGGHLERMKGQAELIAKAASGAPDIALQQAGDILAKQVMASYEGQDGINAMMGTALGVWRAAQRAAREGHGDAARGAAARVAEALWPVAPTSMTQIMTTIDPQWTPKPVDGVSAAALPPIVIQVNGVRRLVIDNPGLKESEEVWSHVQEHHPDFAASHVAMGVERMVWVPGRVLNIIPVKKAVMKP